MSHLNVFLSANAARCDLQHAVHLSASALAPEEWRKTACRLPPAHADLLAPLA